MSKSKGNAMSPADLVDRFGVDAYRYYFLRDVQFGSDGSVSMESMVQRYNGDLANDWGNLCSRLFNMTEKYLDGIVAEPLNEWADDADDTLKAFAGVLPEKYEAAMSGLEYGHRDGSGVGPNQGYKSIYRAGSTMEPREVRRYMASS